MKVPNPSPPDDRRDHLHRPADEAEQQQDRDGHEQPAPQHVRDVQRLPPDLRVAGQVQERADPQDRGDRGDEEILEEAARVQVPDQTWAA